MNIYTTCQNLFILCTCLITLTLSCNSQTPNKPTQQPHPKTTIQPIDTTTRLKYTSGVRSILEDSKGNTWFGSYNEGVCLLRNGVLKYFTTADGLTDNQVRSIYEDIHGMIWFECGVGLSRYDGKKISPYTAARYDAKTSWALTGHDLWFKTSETVGFTAQEGYPGVYQYEGQKLSYHTFPVKAIPGDNFSYTISTPFVKGRKGRIWFGTYNAVIGYDGKHFTVINDSLLGLDRKTGTLHIRGIMEDSRGNLWIANNSIGVIKYDGQYATNLTAEQHLKKADTKGNSLERVFSVGEDKDENMWFGSVEFGAWRYDGHTVKNFTAADGLGSKHIWTIYKSKQGELWFGGADPSGVYRFNGQSFERIY